jgi:hypothetical protein
LKISTNIKEEKDKEENESINQFMENLINFLEKYGFLVELK